jgi:hypothetical protein
MKPVSKKSWHYRTYAWAKYQWTGDIYVFNKTPDLCSYVSTILVQAPLTAAMWAVVWAVGGFFSAIGSAVSTGFDNAEYYCYYRFGTPERAAISGAVIFCLLNALFVIILMKQGVAFQSALSIILKSWGCVIGIIIAAVLIIVVVEWLLKKAKSGGASFGQLVKTWATDGAGNRFCRTLTFID